MADVERLKSLEAENVQLKRPGAGSVLENEVTRDALRKNGKRAGRSGHGAVDADGRCRIKGLSQRRSLEVVHSRWFT